MDECPDVPVRLLGTAAALRERIGYPHEPEEVPAFEQAIATGRSGLADAAFAAAWEAGRLLALEEACAEADALVARFASSPYPEPLENHHHAYGLSRREVEVLRLLAEGYPNRAIADALSISPRTVEHHVLHIMTKLGLPSRAAAAAWAVRNGVA